MSLRLPPVSVQASGRPLPSTRRCCLLPRRPRSTGLGPVCEPPFSLAHGWNQRSRATTRSHRPRATPRAAARAAAAKRLLPARPATDATPSSRNRSRASCGRCSQPTPVCNTNISPATPADHQTACDRDSESAAPARFGNSGSIRSHNPSDTSHGFARIGISKLDDGCRRTSLPPNGSLRSGRAF